MLNKKDNTMVIHLTVNNYIVKPIFKSFYSQSHDNIMVNVPDRRSGHQGSIPCRGTATIIQ